MNAIFLLWLHYLSILSVTFGILSFFIIWNDIGKNPQPMKVMKYVWPINALWAGFVGLLIYYKIGKVIKTSNTGEADDIKPDEVRPVRKKPFWETVTSGTFHCGAGCTLADLVTPWIFSFFPFTILGSLTFGDWTLAYILALFTGVAFQYYAISPMLGKTGLKIWLRALRIDFLSLTAWQVGMYGWMAIVIFGCFGRISPFRIEFWFMMQIAMACGFITAYPANWILIKSGVKTEM